MRADVAIRADASLAIATGHIYRTLVLARALAERGRTAAFIVRPLPGDLIALVRSEGFPVVELGPPEEGNNDWLAVPVERELREARVALAELGAPRSVIVDHYELDTRWETMAAESGARVTALDDLANRTHLGAAVVVDPTPYEAGRYDGKIRPGAELFSGVRYAIVRDAFVEAYRRPRPRDGTIRRIMIFYSGVDPAGETQRALRALARIPGDFRIDVAVGLSSPHRAEIARLAAEDPRAHLSDGGAAMAGLCRDADLALGAPGTAAWERALAGVPSVVTAIGPLQDDVLRRLGSTGAVVPMGRAGSVPLEAYVDTVRSLLNDPVRVRAMSEAARALVEGFEEARAEVLEAVCR